MRRGATFLVVAAIALLPASAEGGKGHHHKHKPTGVKGVVLNSTCPGACAEPPPPPPLYTGTVTINVVRAGDGALVASREFNDGTSGSVSSEALTTSARFPRPRRRVSPLPRRSARWRPREPRSSPPA